MNFNQFIKEHQGKISPYGEQCVALIKSYIYEVFGIVPQSIGNANCYYDRYKELKYLSDNFERIPNTPEFVPKKGDIMVWGLKHGKYGHVAICNGEGNKRYFYSYDQNWNGYEMKLVKHTYKGVSGVLRPRNQDLIQGYKEGNTVEIEIPVLFTGAIENNRILVEYDNLQFWIDNTKYNKGKFKTIGKIAYISDVKYIIEIVEHIQLWINKDNILNKI